MNKLAGPLCRGFLVQGQALHIWVPWTLRHDTFQNFHANTATVSLPHQQLLAVAVSSCLLFPCPQGLKSGSPHVGHGLHSSYKMLIALH